MAVDIIGSKEKAVAIFEYSKESGKSRKEAVGEIVKCNKSVKSVLERVHGTEGVFRLRKHRIVWGGKNTEVVHREHGYFLRMDPVKVYFSPRESTIRQYVASKIKPGERVLVMFAGVGPYAVCISKRQPKVGEVVAVEINPDAARYMRDNVRMNKVAHLVTPLEGDAEKIFVGHGREFDSVVMPMKHAADFLPMAASLCKKNGVIYAYMISTEDGGFKQAEAGVKKIFSASKTAYNIVGKRKVLLYAPGKWKVLMEIRIK